MKLIPFVLALLVAGCAAPEVKVFNQTGGAVRLPSGEKLKLVKFVAPEYPRELRSSGIEGVVRIQFDVASDGSVTDLVVVKSASRKLNRPALAAVAQWRFEPHGLPGKITLQVPVKFEVAPARSVTTSAER